MPPRGELRIDAATVEDVAVILSLIKELAVYERMSDQVVATEADIHRCLCSDSPYAEALIARVGLDTVGFRALLSYILNVPWTPRSLPRGSLRQGLHGATGVTAARSLPSLHESRCAAAVAAWSGRS